MSDKPFEIRAEIAAPPSRVFQALTEEKELAVWLAEEADVDLGAGVYTLSGPSLPSGTRTRLLGHDTDRSLTIGWTFDDGLDRTVAFTLEPGGRGTRLKVTHEGGPSWVGAAAGIGHLLGYAVGNLANHCEGMQVLPRFDFTAPVTGDVRAEIDIEAPPAEVFSALTDPALVNRWCAGESTIEPEVGGRYDFGWGEQGGPVKILELEPDRVLAYSWNEETAPNTVVRWELAGSKGGTHLTIVHSGFGDLRSDGYSAGWIGFLMEIKRVVELGDDFRRIDWS